MAFWTISIFCLPPCRCGIHCYSTNLPVSTGELRAGVSFQGANYKGRKLFLSGIAAICFTATISFFFDRVWFYALYNIQFIVSFGWCIAISAIHHKRVWFVLRSQRKQILFSVIFVLLPFICYTAVFTKKKIMLNRWGYT